MITATLLAATMAAAPLQQIDTTFGVRGESRLSIENMTGNVIVRGWDRDEMRVRASTGRGVEIDAGGSAVRIESGFRWGGNQRVDYEISMPARFAIDVEGINLSVEGDGISGDITIETVNGNVTLSRVSGRTSIEMAQGQATVRESRGDLEVETANGPITIENHEGEISASALNGPITLRGIRSGSVEAETLNGPIEYAGQFRNDGRYTFSTHAANVTLVVPENTNANVSVETFSGQVDAEFPIQVRSVRRGDDISFTLGNGGARIQIESFGGRVILRRPGGGNL
jgi:DUF4097 and DUF4098 domain-containing protein YvlB